MAIIDRPVSLLIQVQTSEERIESYTSRIYGTFLIGGTIQASNYGFKNSIREINLGLIR
jgi:hypothetical protein